MKTYKIYQILKEAISRPVIYLNTNTIYASAKEAAADLNVPR